jgi:exosome complex component MTR3
MCTVHGPHALPRSAPFAAQLQLKTHVKFASFANSTRRSQTRDTEDKDMAARLETALRGVIIAERWPKSGVDIVVTVLEAEQAFSTFDSVTRPQDQDPDIYNGSSSLTVLAGAITVASAAIVDAGIDCLGYVVGGVAVVVPEPSATLGHQKSHSISKAIADPDYSETHDISVACVVAYMAAQDQILGMWLQGQEYLSHEALKADSALLYENLIDRAVEAAHAVDLALQTTVVSRLNTGNPESSLG